MSVPTEAPASSTKSRVPKRDLCLLYYLPLNNPLLDEEKELVQLAVSQKVGLHHDEVLIFRTDVTDFELQLDDTVGADLASGKYTIGRLSLYGRGHGADGEVCLIEAQENSGLFLQLFAVLTYIYSKWDFDYCVPMVFACNAGAFIRMMTKFQFTEEKPVMAMTSSAFGADSFQVPFLVWTNRGFQSKFEYLGTMTLSLFHLFFNCDLIDEAMMRRYRTIENSETIFIEELFLLLDEGMTIANRALDALNFESYNDCISTMKMYKVGGRPVPFQRIGQRLASLNNLVKGGYEGISIIIAADNEERRYSRTPFIPEVDPRQFVQIQVKSFKQLDLFNQDIVLLAKLFKEYVDAQATDGSELMVIDKRVCEENEVQSFFKHKARHAVIDSHLMAAIHEETMARLARDEALLIAATSSQVTASNVPCGNALTSYVPPGRAETSNTLAENPINNTGMALINIDFGGLKPACGGNRIALFVFPGLSSDPDLDSTPNKLVEREKRKRFEDGCISPDTAESFGSAKKRKYNSYTGASPRRSDNEEEEVDTLQPRNLFPKELAVTPTTILIPSADDEQAIDICKEYVLVKATDRPLALKPNVCETCYRKVIISSNTKTWGRTASERDIRIDRANQALIDQGFEKYTCSKTPGKKFCCQPCSEAGKQTPDSKVQARIAALKRWQHDKPALK